MKSATGLRHQYIYIYVVYDGKLFCIPEFLTVFCKVFLHKIGIRFYEKNEYPYLNEIILVVFVQKYNLYQTVVKNGSSILNFYESSACSIIFYNVFSDNVNNLYESILLISSFLFFFVGKVLVANEKNRRNNLYFTDDVNIS